MCPETHQIQRNGAAGPDEGCEVGAFREMDGQRLPRWPSAFMGNGKVGAVRKPSIMSCMTGCCTIRRLAVIVSAR